MHDHGSGAEFLPTYDGNGNVTSLLDAASGVVAAAYEYGPFGEPLRAEVKNAYVSDVTVVSFTFRYSTKFTDSETGLVYYGRRYFSSNIGRFINRDSAEESGGNNLYGFIGNDGINRWDVLGMSPGSPGAGNCQMYGNGIYGEGYYCDAADMYVDNGPVMIGNSTVSAVDHNHPEPLPSPVITFVNPQLRVSDDCFAAKLALIAAQNSGAAYNDRPPAPGWSRVNPKSLGIPSSALWDSESGFGAAIFRNDETGELQVAFRGTDLSMNNDWYTDFAQAFDLSTKQYDSARNLANLVGDYAEKEHVGLSFTGHSLGGGLAAYATMGWIAAGVSGWTFNAAGVNISSSHHLAGYFDNSINAYYLVGEPLHVLNRIPFVPTADGKIIPLYGDGLGLQLAKHGIGAVIDALKKDVSNKCQE